MAKWGIGAALMPALKAMPPPVHDDLGRSSQYIIRLETRQPKGLALICQDQVNR
jgi:hypothetical protein